MRAMHVLLWMMITTVSLCGFEPRSVFAQGGSGAGQSAEKLPPDVNPNSLSRMPRAKREQFTTDEERQAFDRVLALEGRFRAQSGAIGGTLTRIHLPTIAELYRTLLIQLREKSGMEPRYQELTILVASRESNNETEWVAHEKNVVKDFSQDLVEIIRNRKDVKGLGEKEATLIQFGREMARDPKVSSKTFADMERLFGRKSTLAASLIMGYYDASAMLFRAYDQRLNPGVKPPFPSR
jgi:4-carboxymuconolactone decarboxylase